MSNAIRDEPLSLALSRGQLRMLAASTGDLQDNVRGQIHDLLRRSGFDRRAAFQLGVNVLVERGVLDRKDAGQWKDLLDAIQFAKSSAATRVDGERFTAAVAAIRADAHANPVVIAFASALSQFVTREPSTSEGAPPSVTLRAISTAESVAIGVAAGASIGLEIGGPIGAAAGAIVGGVVGAVGGECEVSTD